MCCPCPLLSFSVCLSLCLELPDISHSPLPPLLSPCVITDSPSSGILQHSRLDFLSPLLSDGQITEVVNSTLLLHLHPPFLSSQPGCMCVFSASAPYLVTLHQRPMKPSSSHRRTEGASYLSSVILSPFSCCSTLMNTPELLHGRNKRNM